MQKFGFPGAALSRGVLRLILHRLLYVGVKGLLKGLLPALLSATALAHELDLQLRIQDSQTIAGALLYSDNSASAGEYIRVTNLSDPTYSEFALQTDDAGKFVFVGVPSHHYAVTALGQEGHQVTAEIVLDKPTAEAASGQGVPIYVYIAVFLLLSLIPAYFLRHRDAQ